MKNLNLLNEYRQELVGMIGDETCGSFIIPSKNGKFKFHVIASIDTSIDNGKENTWDHVSVSLVTWDEKNLLERCPKWDEMCYIKDLFFEDEEEAIQYHPKKSEYVNIHPYVLHMWRPHGDLLKVPM